MSVRLPRAQLRVRWCLRWIVAQRAHMTETNSLRKRPSLSSPYSTKGAVVRDPKLAFADVEVAQDAKPGMSPSLTLSPEQAELLSLLQSEHNVFFSGRAGTGKSEVLRHFIQLCEQSHKKVGVVAATGIAASHIGGRTLHSFMSYVKDMSWDKTAYATWVSKARGRIKPYLETDVLVIDEASMVCPNLFDALEYAARKVRAKYKKNRQLESIPFGGIQVVICGDFYQLPPIDKSQHLEVNENGDLPEPNFVFDSFAWKFLILKGMKMLELWQVFRQTDPLFLNVLNKVRVGVYDDEVKNVLNKCKDKQWSDDQPQPTLIACYKSRVNRHNNLRLQQLEGPAKMFTAIDSYERPSNKTLGGFCSPLIPFQSTLPETDQPETVLNREFDSFTAHRLLTVKVGARVVLLHNIDISRGLVNGARGFLLGYRHMQDTLLGESVDLPVVRFDSGETLVISYRRFQTCLGPSFGTVVRCQIPLSLAWALTVHKSQGMTLENAEVDLSGVFACGQAYTALSRVKSLNGLKVRLLQPESIFASKKVHEFWKSVKNVDEQFRLQNGWSTAEHDVPNLPVVDRSVQTIASSEEVGLMDGAELPENCEATYAQQQPPDLWSGEAAVMTEGDLSDGRFGSPREFTIAAAPAVRQQKRRSLKPLAAVLVH